MAHFSIISSQGQHPTLFTGAPRYVGAYLKPGYLEFPAIGSPTAIDWHVGDYVVYTRTGLTYRLYGTPQTAEQATARRYGAAFLYENVQLFDDSKQLELCPFSDLVPEDNEIHFSTINTVSFWGKPMNVAERIEACLLAQYGANSWAVRIVDTSDADILEILDTEVEFSVSGVNCLGVLDKVYDTWGLGWYFTVENGKNIITIGAPNVRASANTTEEYSYGNGLTRVRRSVSNADELGTRLFAYGSLKNMPADYYRGQEIANAESVDIENLMIPLSSWGLTDGLPDARKAFIEDATAIARLGLIPRYAYFDGTGDLPDIHPSIESVTIGDVYDANPSSYRPNLSKWTRSQRIDEVVSATNPEDHGTSAEQGQKYTETISGSIIAQSEPFVEMDTISIQLFTATLTKAGNLTLRFDQTPQVISLSSSWTPIFDVKLIVSATGARKQFPVTIVQTGAQALELTFPDTVSVPGVLAGVIEVRLEGVVNRSDGDAPGSEGTITISSSTSIDGGVQYDLEKTFSIRIPQIGFDIEQYADLGNGKTISMKTGMCAARDFEIKDVRYVSSADAWDLTLYRSIDEDLNLMFPNADYEIAAGDRFVLLDIAMPEIYITAASQRLLQAAQKLLSDISTERPMYEPEIDAKVVYNESRVLREGLWMRIVFNGVTDYILIDSITIDENGANIPTYEVVLREKKGVEWTESIGRSSSSSRSSQSVNGAQMQDSGGTVTSVGMIVPTGLSVTGSPITTSGTLAISFASGYSIPTTAKQGNWDTAYSTVTTSQTKNKVFASPSNASGAPSFRALVAADIPNLDWSKITSGKPTNLSGYGITDGVNDVEVSGSGNAVTTASITGHKLTLTKGTTFLTSHQAIYTLTLSAGAFSAGTFTANSAAASFNIPTTLDHITDGSTRSLANYVLKAGDTMSGNLAICITPIANYPVSRTNANLIIEDDTAVSDGEVRGGNIILTRGYSLNANQSAGAISFYGRRLASGYRNGARIAGVAGSDSTAYDRIDLVFYASNDNTDGTPTFVEALRIKANGTTNPANSIIRTFGASDENDGLRFVGGEYDNYLLTVASSSTTPNVITYGYGLKYIGSGSGVANYLRLMAGNRGGTPVTAIGVNQNGQIGILTDADTNYALKVNGAAYATSLKIGSATITWNSDGYLHIDKPLVTAGDQIVISGTPGGGGGGGATTLAALDDVSLTSLASGNLLQYDGSAWVNVAATSVGKIYTAGSGISLGGTNSTVINHSNSVTAKTSYGSTATTASANGGTITVTDVKYDAQGHITASTDRTITLSQVDTKNTAGADNTTSKIFLVGPTAQTSSNGTARTYSNANCYASGGKLYSNAKEVVNLSDTQALTNKTYNGYTLAAACAKAVVTSIDTSASLPTSDAVKTFVEGKGYLTSVAFADLTAHPTTLNGYGITDAQPLDADLTAIAAINTGTGLLKRSVSGSTVTWSIDTNTYLTGNQTITLSGDVSGSGSTSISVSIGSGKVTNTMLAGSINWSKLLASSIPTTISGYGITDAKFGTAGTDYIPITLGSTTKNVLTAHQSVTLASGTNNGTLKLTVNGTATDNIAVKGLGSMAYETATNYVPTTRTVNSKALSANITLTLDDIGNGSTRSLANYVLKAGDTMTGDITMTNGEFINAASGYAMLGIGSGGTTFYCGPGNEISSSFLIRSGDIDLTHAKAGTNYKIWDASNSNLSTVSWAANDITAAGSVTAVGAGSFDTLTLTSTSAVAHLAFSRGGYNYIAAPSGGSIGFVPNGLATGSANSRLLVSDTEVAITKASGGARLAIQGTSANGAAGEIWFRARSSSYNGVKIIGVQGATSNSYDRIALEIQAANGTSASNVTWKRAMRVTYGANVIIGASGATVTFTQYGDMTINGSITSTGDQVVSSDATLKTNWRGLNYGVADIAKATAGVFDWKDGRGSSAGTIAQDWKKLVPELVHGEEGNMTLAYGQVAMLNTILLARTSEDHEERIKALEAENKRLKEEINRLRMN